MPTNPRQVTLFRSWLRLSERFYEQIITRPVPVDLRAIRALARSPIAMDIYCWLTYRSATVSRPTLVPWEALYCQFGSESRLRKFRELFCRSLKDVLMVYPRAKVEAGQSGITVFPGPPSVPRQVAA